MSTCGHKTDGLSTIDTVRTVTVKEYVHDTIIKSVPIKVAVLAPSSSNAGIKVVRDTKSLDSCKAAYYELSNAFSSRYVYNDRIIHDSKNWVDITDTIVGNTIITRNSNFHLTNTEKTVSEVVTKIVTKNQVFPIVGVSVVPLIPGQVNKLSAGAILKTKKGWLFGATYDKYFNAKQAGFSAFIGIKLHLGN